MKLVKCDKCLREWPEESYPSGLVVMDDYAPRRTTYSRTSSLSGAPIELCASCARHFRNWLDEVTPYDTDRSET